MAVEASYIGKGRVFLGPYGGGSAAREIGNVSKLEFAVTEDVKDLLDYTSAGGGKANSLRRISAVNCNMTLHDIVAENLAVAAFGTTSAVTAGAVASEAHSEAWVGGLTRTAFNIDTTQTVTVTGASATPTFTLGTDYEVTTGGVIITNAHAGWTNGSAIEISYTKKAGSVVQALVNSAQEYRLIFVGLNEAQSGRAVTVVVHRAKFGALQNLGLISDDFAGVDLNGEALKDSAITTAGLSQFWTAELATAA